MSCLAVERNTDAESRCVSARHWAAAKLWGNLYHAMIGCIAKLQEEIRRTNRKVRHEPLDESKAFNNYTITTIFWWMNIHLPVNLMFTKDAFDTSPASWGSWRESPDWQVPWSIHWRWMQNWHKQIHCEMTKKNTVIGGGLLIFGTLDGIPSKKVSHQLEGCSLVGAWFRRLPSALVGFSNWSRITTQNRMIHRHFCYQNMRYHTSFWINRCMIQWFSFSIHWLPTGYHGQSSDH